MGSLDKSQNQNGISIRFSSRYQAKEFSVLLGPCDTRTLPTNTRYRTCESPFIGVYECTLHALQGYTGEDKLAEKLKYSELEVQSCV